MKIECIDGSLYIVARIDDVPKQEPPIIVDIEAKRKCEILLGLNQ